MTRKTSPKPPHFMLFSFALTTVLASGCTALDLPVLTYAKPSSPEYRSIEPSFQLEPFNSEQAYYSVRQARSQNSIVLEVAGDSTPVRVFPLPPGQKSVFVSDLLNQTGIQKKFGSLKATLFRYSPDSIGGLRMEVKMAPDGRSVRPVSDYALHAGDRLRVDKATSPALTGLVNMMLGRQSN